MEQVSIRAPRAGGDKQKAHLERIARSFNPRPPCGGRHAVERRGLADVRVSIRAPRAGGDAVWNITIPSGFMFQSAPPVRGATLTDDPRKHRPEVSIRAPRAGGDRIHSAHQPHRAPVSIRAPRAGGDSGFQDENDASIVSIRAPRAGGDVENCIRRWQGLVSIRAPRAGGDCWGAWPMVSRKCFNPRPPCGGRQSRGEACRRPAAVSIRAPRAGGDGSLRSHMKSSSRVSIRAPRAGGDRGESNCLPDKVLATDLREPYDSEQVGPTAAITFSLQGSRSEPVTLRANPQG